MKRLTMIAMLLAGVVMSVCGQNRGYECTYQMTMGVPEQMQQIEDEAMRNAIIAQMSQMKMFFKLSYYNGRSFFELDAERTDNPFAGQAGQNIFIDFGKKSMVSQEAFFGHYFLIEEDLETPQWSIGKEQKTIAGRTCTKATVANGEHVVTAWFSSETPIPCGPMTYWGLPGLIVQLEMEGNTFTLTDVRTVEKPKEIKAPTKGKKVSREEYNKLLEERLQQMGVSRSGGGVQVIQMR